jgi:hypothetical protein
MLLGLRRDHHPAVDAPPNLKALRIAHARFFPPYLPARTRRVAIDDLGLEADRLPSLLRNLEGGNRHASLTAHHRQLAPEGSRGCVGDCRERTRWRRRTTPDTTGGSQKGSAGSCATGDARPLRLPHLWPRRRTTPRAEVFYRSFMPSGAVTRSVTMTVWIGSSQLAQGVLVGDVRQRTVRSSHGRVKGRRAHPRATAAGRCTGSSASPSSAPSPRHRPAGPIVSGSPATARPPTRPLRRVEPPVAKLRQPLRFHSFRLHVLASY